MRTRLKTLIRITPGLLGILLSAVGMFLGYELGSETAELLGGEPGTWARVGKGFVWGGVIAGLQWPIVRAVGVPPLRFLVASAVCFAAGYPLGHTAQGILNHWGLNWIVAYGSALAILGLSLSMPQWWAFRRHMRHASLWLPLSVLGWILTGAAWVNFGVNSGEDAIAYGVVTGLGLVWLVRSQRLCALSDKASHTPPASVLRRDTLIALGLGVTIIVSWLVFFGQDPASFTVDKTVDPAVYDAYAGEYKIENIGLVKITRGDEHLYIQVSNRPRFEIFPRTQTEFFLKVVQADITFTKDQERQSQKSDPEGVRPALDGAEGEVAGQLSLAGCAGGLHIKAGGTLAVGTFWSGLIDDVRLYDRAVKS